MPAEEQLMGICNSNHLHLTCPADGILMPALRQCVTVTCNFMSDLSYKYNWLQVAFTEQVDKINECFYFDRRDNEFYSIFITDFLLTDKNSKDVGNSPYSEEELAILKERIDRHESNDSSILSIPRLTIDERKQMMQSFLDTQSKFHNNGLLQKTIDTENGRTYLDFNDLIDFETNQAWKSFKATFVRERIDSFCNLNNIDIESATLWTEDKMTRIELDLNDDGKPTITKSSKPWWKFW